VVVQSITITPTNPIPIDRIRVQVSVENPAPVPSGLFTYEIRLDGQVIQSARISLAGNEQSRVFASINGLSAGTHTVEGILDTQNVVKESDESNNTMSSTFQVVTQPVVDLLIQDVSILPVNPTAADQITIRGLIEVAGPNAVAPPINWEFRLNGQVVGGGQWTFSPLQPTAKLTVSSNALGPLAAGQHTAELMVDPFDTIAETDEANNTAVINFTVN